MFKLILVLFLITVATHSLAKICPDEHSRCPSTATCCKTSSGYGCCPYVNATCCSDQSHCCPNHLKCDVEKSRCVQQSGVPVPFPFSYPAMDSWNEVEENKLLSMIEVEAKTKLCPDGVQKCPDTYTCCAIGNGGYGCCPERDGVCCADGIHCCPKDRTCNVAKGRCDSK